jgi:hypothetical protein
MSNKLTDTNNNKDEDGKFKIKKIKHNPKAESARAMIENNKKK